MLMNSIILAISGCDAWRPLGIEYKPFRNSLHDSKYHNNVVVFSSSDFMIKYNRRFVNLYISNQCSGKEPMISNRDSRCIN